MVRASALEIGTQIGPYFIRDVLGRGSQGIVYLARRQGDTHDHALKVIHPGADEMALARFEREASTTAALEHEGIVPVRDYGRAEGGLLWYAMQRVEASANLDRRILSLGPLEPDDAARLAIRLARAVDHAHESGVIHRDLKPSNVLLAGGSIKRPMISDFGLALVRGESRLTQTGAFVGTPCYLAPEIVRGGSASRSSDVYALGAILYECLVGRPPYEGTSIGAILERVLHASPESPRRVQPDVPPAIERVCMSCLEKLPAHRPGSAASVARALEQAIGERELSVLDEARQGVVAVKSRLRRICPVLAGVTLGLEIGFLVGLLARIGAGS